MGRKVPTPPPYKPDEKVVRPAPPPLPPKQALMDGMMKIENLSKAVCLQEQLRELEDQYRVVKEKGNGGLGITIQSRYQDDAFVDAIRFHVLDELNQRIGDKRRRLAELGITFA